MAQAKNNVDYRTLSQELEIIISDLQRDDLNIDEALKKYERGLEITQTLEKYLQTAENKVTELKARFDATA